MERLRKRMTHCRGWVRPDPATRRPAAAPIKKTFTLRVLTDQVIGSTF
nr:MAG TPA: hypothetical protein [Caudoviricetes sp.]